MTVQGKTPATNEKIITSLSLPGDLPLEGWHTSAKGSTWSVLKNHHVDAEKVRFIMIHHHFNGILRTSIFLGTTVRVLKHTKTWCGAHKSDTDSY